MSRIADTIRECVKDPQSTGVFEYGSWGALRKDQRARIRELCDACDMFEVTADNFGKSLMVYKRALELACENIKDVVVSWLQLTGGKLQEPYKIKNETYFLQQAKKELEKQDDKR